MSIYLDIENYNMYCPKCNSSNLKYEDTEISGEDVYSCCKCGYWFGETSSVMIEKTTK